MRNKRIFYATLTVLWVALIFSFSLQPGEVSGDISGSFLHKVIEWFAPGVFERLETIPQEQLEFWHTILRKCAHFSEFLVLGVLSSMTLLRTKILRREIFGMGFCLAVAAADETIQLFVDGRAGRATDVMIDGAGALVGVVMVAMVVRKKIMREFILNISNKLSKTKFVVVLSFLWQSLSWIEYALLQIKWAVTGKKKPGLDETRQLREECTIIFKSFERQRMARRLYKNIQKYYPGIRVIIADDSEKPLELQCENLEIIQLPFNSGLCYGINRALEKVTTPYVIRMDDDELLTPFTRFEKQLEFLKRHPEVDLVGVLPYALPKRTSLKRAAKVYYMHPMGNAPKPLKIPHMTRIDETHTVLGKVPNIFIARTDKVKEIGYDDNIRMIDHHEFFYRAAGNLVAVLDVTSFVIHYHNRYDMHYEIFRKDVMSDKIYITNKMRKK